MSLPVPLLAAISGATVTRLSLTGSGTPARIAAGPDGNVWFLDEAAKAVGKIVVSGSAATATSYPISLPAGQTVFNFARAITGGSDAVWFSAQGCSTGSCASATNNLGRVTADGTVTLIPLTGESNAPSSMVVGPDGNIWMTGSSMTYVLRATPQGQATRFTPPSGKCCSGQIIVGPDNNLWFAEKGMIGRITTSGVITEFAVPAASVLTSGPDGNIWFDASKSQLGRLKPDGTVTLYTLPDANAYPGGLIAGADGNIWFSEHFDPRLGRLVLSSATDDGKATVEIESFSGFGRGGDIVALPRPASPAGATTSLASSFSLIFDYYDPSGGGSLVEVTTAPALPDLIITKGHSLSMNESGARVSYIFQIVNRGNGQTAGPIQISDTLPEGFTLSMNDVKVMLGGDNVQYDSATRRITITIYETIPPGSFTTRTIVGSLPPDILGVFSNQATVSGGSDSDSTNNSSNVDLFTVDNAKVSMTKEPISDPDTGKFLFWWVQLTNYASDGKTLTDITLSDDLGSGTGAVTADVRKGTYLNVEANQGGATCSMTGTVMTCRVDPLAPREAVTFKMAPTIAPADGTTNTVTLEGPLLQLRAVSTYRSRRATPVADDAPANVSRP